MEREELCKNTDSPKIGVFWYDEKEGKLIGVHSIPVVLNENEYCFFNQTHDEIWKELKKQALENKANNQPYNPIFLNNSENIPRGKVGYKENKRFYVWAGYWIEQDKAENEKVKQLICEAFNISQTKLLFYINEDYDVPRYMRKADFQTVLLKKRKKEKKR